MSASRTSVLATVALLGLGGCGDAFTNADSPDGSAAQAEGGASEGGGSSGDGGGSFCAMQSAAHLFCDDFDDRAGTASAIVQGKWSPGETQSAAASVSIDDAGANTPSPPNSFFAQTTSPIPTLIQTLALLSENVGRLGQSQRLEASFDMMVTSYGGNAMSNEYAIVFSVAFGNPSYALALGDATHATFLELGGGADGGASASHPLSATFPPNTWVNTSVRLDAPGVATPGHVTITLTAPGQTAIKALDVDLVETASVSTAPATVTIGVAAQMALSTWAVRFDDVLLDTL